MTARLPSLNGLRAFEAAARHLSFTNAASELNVTQTAISHQIRRLEEELGISLFVRQQAKIVGLIFTPGFCCSKELMICASAFERGLSPAGSMNVQSSSDFSA